MPCACTESKLACASSLRSALSGSAPAVPVLRQLLKLCCCAMHPAGGIEMAQPCLVALCWLLQSLCQAAERRSMSEALALHREPATWARQHML